MERQGTTRVMRGIAGRREKPPLHPLDLEYSGSARLLLGVDLSFANRQIYNCLDKW